MGTVLVAGTGMVWPAAVMVPAIVWVCDNAAELLNVAATEGARVRVPVPVNDTAVPFCISVPLSARLPV
jgi:hypothetical protein